MSPDRVAGVLLAAGLSSRLGENKLFLRLGGQTLLRRAASAALSAGLDEVQVVLGHEHERARAELAGLPVQCVLNPEYARGMNSSLRAGIAALPQSAAAAVVLLCDMPLVTGEMIADLVARWRSAPAPLAVSLYGDVVAPPILYTRALFPELRALDDHGSGKRVVQQHRAEALEVARPPDALADLDLPEDLRALLGAQQ